jgi:hypothetical protein
LRLMTRSWHVNLVGSFFFLMSVVPSKRTMSGPLNHILGCDNPCPLLHHGADEDASELPLPVQRHSTSTDCKDLRTIPLPRGPSASYIAL